MKRTRHPKKPILLMVGMGLLVVIAGGAALGGLKPWGRAGAPRAEIGAVITQAVE